MLPQLPARLSLILLCISLLGVPEALAQVPVQHVFSVDNTGDASDTSPGDGACMTIGSGCTLRAALEEANALANVDVETPDTITFDIASAATPDAPHVIEPTSELPAISEAVIIDGRDQPGYDIEPVIEIDGHRAGADANGLTFQATGNEIYGLAIINFEGHGIQATRAYAIDHDIIDCHVGVRADGTTAAGNANGISLTGSDLISGSIIGGNAYIGVRLGDNSTIEGSYIGTNPGGDDLGNGSTGLFTGEDGNIIGGTTPGAANVIAFNAAFGAIRVAGGVGNTIQGNYIGTNPSGDSLGNSGSGITLEAGASGNQIGGTSAGAGNVISANSKSALVLTGAGTTRNIVQGNYIGLTPGGDAALGNGSSFGQYDGAIELTDGASDNVIGGTTAEARNVIAGTHGSGTDSGNGISVSGPTTTGNVIIGNYIGVGADGVTAVPNHGHGMSLTNLTSSNRIGIDESDIIAGNVIAGNGEAGISMGGFVNDNLIKGNSIGVGADGVTGIGNGKHGVWIRYAAGSGNIIGYDLGDVLLSGATEGNIIAHNGGSGVLLSEQASSADRTTIRGNRIFANDAVGIDLSNDNFDPDGRTVNDAGDGDDGINNLQNFPNIQSSAYDEASGELSVEFMVPSDPSLTGEGASTYPLTVDFYRADADAEEGAEYLGTRRYTSSDYSACGSPPCSPSISFEPEASVTHDDYVLATATDASGNSSEFSLAVSLAPPNQPPFVSVALPDTTVDVDDNLLTLTLVDYFSDPDGDDLTYTASSSSGEVATAAISGDELEVSLAAVGEATITVTAQDASGSSADDTFVVTINDNVALDGPAELPAELTLYQNAPNPFARETTIRYALPKPQHVRLDVYDMLGRRVRVLVDEKQNAGIKTIRFRTREALPSGVYFYRLQAGDTREVRKMIVVK